MPKTFLETDYGKELSARGDDVRVAIKNGYAPKDRDKAAKDRIACALSVLAAQAYDSKIYRFAEDFTRELVKAKISVPPSHLKFSSGPILIEIPDGVLTHPDGRNFTAVALWEQQGFGIFAFLCPGRLSKYSQFALHGMCNYATTEDFLEQAVKSGTVDGTYAPLFRFVVSALMYLESGDPDLRELRPPKKPHNFKGRERAWLRLNKDESKYPIIQVGFSYKKKTLYTVSGTTVRGHFRWQPCGAGRTQVRLIWIESHEREYTTDLLGAEPKLDNLPLP